MLCGDVKRSAYFFLDGSLREPESREFERHLALCPECETRLTIHRRLRRFLRERLAPVTAPAALRVRLSHSLRSAG